METAHKRGFFLLEFWFTWEILYSLFYLSADLVKINHIIMDNPPEGFYIDKTSKKGD